MKIKAVLHEDIFLVFLLHSSERETWKKTETVFYCNREKENIMGIVLMEI